MNIGEKERTQSFSDSTDAVVQSSLRRTRVNLHNRDIDGNNLLAWREHFWLQGMLGGMKGQL